jgi:hypothetical protein
MVYRGRVVSLLMTANDGGTGIVGQDAIPHVIGRPLNGLSVVSVNGARHAILLVSDLDTEALAQLSGTVSVPLARRLEASLAPDRGSLASLQFEHPFGSSIFNSLIGHDLLRLRYGLFDVQPTSLAISVNRGLTQCAAREAIIVRSSQYHCDNNEVAELSVLLYKH